MTVKMNKKMRIFVIAALLLAVATAALRTYMLVTVVDVKTGLYEPTAQWANFFETFVLILSVVIAVSGMLLFKKADNLAEPDSSSTFTVFGSGLCAFMYASVFVSNVVTFMNGNSNNMFFLAAQTVLCIPCTVNHLHICAKEKREKSTAQALLAMSPSLFFAVRIIDVFMSVETQINSSQRSLELLMLCAIMLFTLYEAEFTVQKKEISKKTFAGYYISALGTVSLALVAMIPYLLVSVFFEFQLASVLMSVLQCCIMIYAVSRVFTAQTK